VVLHAGSGALAAEGAEAAAAPFAPPGWQLPSPTLQFEMDKQLIPMGKGAIFVPAPPFIFDIL
jgi:hypothetical protein